MGGSSVITHNIHLQMTTNCALLISSSGGVKVPPFGVLGIKRSCVEVIQIHTYQQVISRKSSFTMTTTSSSMGTAIPPLCISTTSSSSMAAPGSLSQGAAVNVVMHHRLDAGSSAGDTQERERSPRPARRGASHDVGIRPSAASARSDAGSAIVVRRPASLG